MDKDLDTLLKVALSATPGPWKAEPYLYGMTGEGCRIRVTSPSTDDRHNLADDILQEDAEFIATFDPPTVIELIEQVEYYKRKNETLAALGKANHDWNMQNRADLTTRLGQAEQAVARVREAIKDAPTYDPTRGFAGPPDDYPDIHHFIGNGEWKVAERVRKALDGAQG